MSSVVLLSIGYFADPLIGKPVSEGYIYIGNPDTDPTVGVNQKSISVLEEDGSVTPVSQPLRTSAGGVPLYNGSPVTILAAAPFSITVLRKTLSQAYYVPTMGVGDLVGDVYSDDGTKVLENGTDGSDAIFTGHVVGTLAGDVEGNVTGNTTGDHIGQVQADDFTMVLDPGTDGSAVIFNAVAISGAAIKDEDDMSSDSATHLATQQSIKAYVDALLGQNTETFDATGTFNVPSDISLIYVTACGGGGGGGTGGTGAGQNGGGGGGSGAALLSYLMPVTPSGTVSVTIGAGGASTTDGENTLVGDIIIPGGNQGVDGAVGTAGGASVSDLDQGFAGVAGGAGGTTANGVAGSDFLEYDGGAGALDGGGDYAGGGGGGAGLFGDGADGGIGVLGGPGGTGSSAGANTGAGAGGGGEGTGTSNGGSGGSGKVIITW